MFFLSCSEHEYNNPYDPGSPNYDSSLTSSSSAMAASSSSSDGVISSSFEPIPGDNTPLKPPFTDEWFTGNPSDGSCAVCEPLPNNGTFPNITQIWNPEIAYMVSVPPTNTTVHGFGQKGTPISPNRAGELILTAFPTVDGIVNTIYGPMPYQAWKDDKEMQKLFGLPPEQSPYGPYGIADPKMQATDGGYQFVKNGFPNESSVGSNGALLQLVAFQTEPTQKNLA
ncbi:hypothetical protein R83H12_02128 [Fibrobacteria bacterium R8-3-H12]